MRLHYPIKELNHMQRSVQKAALVAQLFWGPCLHQIRTGTTYLPRSAELDWSISQTAAPESEGKSNAAAYLQSPVVPCIMSNFWYPFIIKPVWGTKKRECINNIHNKCSFQVTQYRKEVIQHKKRKQPSITIGQWSKKVSKGQSNADGASFAWLRTTHAFLLSLIFDIFSCILLISNHMISSVQFHYL